MIAQKLLDKYGEMREDLVTNLMMIVGFILFFVGLGFLTWIHWFALIPEAATSMWNLDYVMAVTYWKQGLAGVGCMLLGLLSLHFYSLRIH